MVFDPIRKVYWLASSQGLYRLEQNQQRWNAVQVDSLVDDKKISSLLLDHNGKLWMTVSSGLLFFDPDDKTTKNYTLADGLQGLDYHPKSTLIKNDHHLYFGGTNGLTSFYPEKIQSAIPLPRATIVDIKINQKLGVPQKYTKDGIVNPMYIQELFLPRNQNNLTFMLSALEYSDPASCRFRYQLLNSTDPSIIEYGARSQLDFTNLSPGNYILRIWASNADRVWSKEPHEIRIHVAFPWYRTFWFFGSVILFLLAFCYGAYRIRLHTVNLQRKAAETETAVLRLQMDPHFIFNSMNAIAAYVLRVDKFKAHRYLGQFADMMRAILNSSEEPTTNLEGEIALLDKYLSTEQMRLGPGMTYDFRVDPAIDTYDTHIPTMILQPFVENAVWHGIMPNESKGHIRIAFQEKDGELLCVVDDNGGGRKKQTSAKKHKSKALSITERRLELLHADGRKKQARFEIIDKKSETGEPLGTRVNFYFPLNR
jgi:hypothetical protein